MELNTGCSLALFINENSTRFSAKVLHFGQKSWVIIQDHDADHPSAYAEPIADVSDYLARGERKIPPMDGEYRNLLLSWESSQANAAEVPVLEAAEATG